ncbi:MAG: hypothetical protein IJ519_00555 [Clostridia bacterium]|nr:hypothetical protein [Clostridia bacterium]
MNMIKQFFPFSAKAKDVTSLVIAIAIYLVAGAVAGFILGLLAGTPIIGFIFGLAGALVGLYCLVGIILSVLDFLEIKF